MKFSFLLLGLLLGLLLANSLPLQASHLSEAEVLALENSCEVARERKLQPQKAAVLEQCLRQAELDRAGCEQQAGNYGERSSGAIRRLGKYYDLPECVTAYQARKHYKLNPGY